MKKAINSTTGTLSKIAENENRIKIITAKSETSLNELKNHIINTPMTHSQLAEICKELNTIKAENEQLINENKLILDEIKLRIR